MEKRSIQKKESYSVNLEKISKILDKNTISQVIIHGENKIEKEIEGEKTESWKLTPDLDAESASILLNFFNKKPLEEIYKEGSLTSVIPKGGNDKYLEETKDGVLVYIDNGNKWLEVEKDKKKTKIYFDHHGEGQGPRTSATKMIYHLLKNKDQNLDQNFPWLYDYVENVNNFDNLNYVNKKNFDETYFKTVYPYSLNNIARKMKALDLMNLFNDGFASDFSLNMRKDLEKEVEIEKFNEDSTTRKEKIKFKDIILKNGKTLETQIQEEKDNVEKTIKGIGDADKIESPLLGKVVYHNNKKIKNKNGNGTRTNIIPNHLGFSGTKALGRDTFVSWNKKNGNFFINSNEKGLAEVVKKLNEIDPGCALDVRGVMVFGKINNMTEEEFLKIIKGEEFSEKITNETKEINLPKEAPIKSETEIIDEKIQELKRKKEDLDKKIAELEAMILALPDDEEINLDENNEKNRMIPIKLTEKGTFDEKSIMRYFAMIFYNQRGGFIDFKEHELEDMSPETKSYLLRIYEDLKKHVEEGKFEIFDAEKVLARDIKNGKTGGHLEKIKIYNGKDYWFDNKIVESEVDKINFARMMLSNDLSGRDSGLINGINKPSQIKSIEYPSPEVLKNLDKVFNGNSKKYDAEIKTLDQENTITKAEEELSTEEAKEIRQTMEWFSKAKNKIEERVAKRIYQVPNSSVYVKLNKDGTYKETGYLNEKYEYETDKVERPDWESYYNKVKNIYQKDVGFLEFLNSEITANFIQLGKKLSNFNKIERILNEKYDSFKSDILLYATNLDDNPTDYLSELHDLDTKYPERQVKNEVNKIFKTELAELETKNNKPQIKRDGRENYEGWETRYHHDIEADDKSLRMSKETKKQTPMSLYELKEKDKQMALFLIESNSITKMLGAFGDRQLEPLFNLPEGRSDSPDIKLMKTIKPAKFRKEGEFWVLEEKGEVEYVK